MLADLLKRQKTPLIQRLLDYLFISNDLQDSALKVYMFAVASNDHSALLLVFMKQVGLKGVLLFGNLAILSYRTLFL